MVDIPVNKPNGIPTMFGTIYEKNITILLDTSGSMYAFLQPIKEHILEMLLERSFKLKDTMFNIIEFSSEVIPWADKLVRCTPQTVTIAGEWLRRLTSKTSTNTLDALIAGFADPVCEAVYLLTDGLPDQNPDKIVRCVGKIAMGRPVHAIYLTSPRADTPAYNFLENLARQTKGTFQVTCLSQHGNIEKVTTVVTPTPTCISKTVYAAADFTEEPLITLDNPPVSEVKTYGSIDPIIGTSQTTVDETNPETSLRGYQGQHQEAKFCSVTTTLDHKPVAKETIYVQQPMGPGGDVVQYGSTSWQSIRPTQMVKKLFSTSIPLYAEKGLPQGTKVLARHNKDGFYRPGILTTEITPHHTCLVTFERDPKGGSYQTLVQECPLHDIIAYDDAMSHTITPGDKVLASWEKGTNRQGPGSVLEGIEGRSAGCAADTDYLIVNFFNGRTERVPKNTAMRISPEFFELIKQEIQVPLSARQYNRNDHIIWKNPTSCNAPQRTNLVEFESISNLNGGVAFPMYVPVYTDPTYPHMYRMPNIKESAIKSEQVSLFIPGTGMTKEELDKKISAQLMENGVRNMRFYEGREERSKKMVSFGSQTELAESSRSSTAESIDMEIKDMESTSDSGCEDEEDSTIDRGIQTLSLVDSCVGTDSSLLYPSKSQQKMKEQADWRYWRQTPQPKQRRKVSPFRHTAMSAPLEPRLQFHVEPKSVISTEFNDKDQVKTDKAQTEWIYRQPRPPSNTTSISSYDKPSSVKMRPASGYYPNSTYPGDHVGPSNRSAAFDSVKHKMKSDLAEMERYLHHYNQHYVPVMQGPGQPVSQSVGKRDMMREDKRNAQLQNKREQVVQREAEYKRRETRIARMRDAKDERNREFTAGIIQRDRNRERAQQNHTQQSLQAKRANNNDIRQREETRSEREMSREKMKVEALTQRHERREAIREQREKEIQDTINRRNDIKQQRVNDRSERHVERLSEHCEQQAARDDQMRQSQLQRREHFRRIEQANQDKKDLRTSVHMQRLQEYRSQVLP